MQITSEHLLSCFPTLKNSAEWLEAIDTNLNKYNIKSVEQVAMFLAQTGHESGDFKFLKENLNYSAEGLLKTFPKYFIPQTAADCARNPEKIANIVYANRMGNGPKESGDGFKYIGRGLIQITGKSNYALCSKFIFNDERLLTNPSELENINMSVLSAIWFWKSTKLDTITDIVVITKRINGGTHGLDDRTIRYGKYLHILSQ